MLQIGNKKFKTIKAFKQDIQRQIRYFSKREREESMNGNLIKAIDYSKIWYENRPLEIKLCDKCRRTGLVKMFGR